jgi:prepilin-type N-terminal cleavage/methylation domain-containing protein
VASLGRRSAAGFTVVEILMAVAIVAILSAIAIAHLQHSRMAANEARAIMDIREMFTDRPGNPADVNGAPIICPSPDPGPKTSAGYSKGCTAGVFWATPEIQGKTGIRGFGIDGSGRTCFTADGSIPKMASGCSTLQ